MSGWSAFATIGDERYVLTLPGHGFYLVFAVRFGAGAALGYRRARAAARTAHPRACRATASARRSAAKRSRSSNGEVLPAYLPTQRWFAGKDGRRCGGGRRRYRAHRDGRRCDASLTVVDALGRYFVPLAIVDEGDERNARQRSRDASRARAPARAAGTCATRSRSTRSRSPSSTWSARDERTLDAWRHVHGPSDAGACATWTVPERPRVARIDVEQSNTSVVFDERVILKGLSPGPAGPATRTRSGALSRCRRVSPHAAALRVRRTRDRRRRDDGTVHAARRSSKIKATVGRRRSPTSTASSTGAVSLDAGVRAGERVPDAPSRGERRNDAIRPRASRSSTNTSSSSRACERLGRRTAELHRAFATPRGDPAFEPEPLDASRRRRSGVAQARGGAQAALAALAREMERVPADMREFAAELLERREELLERTRTRTARSARSR